MATTSVLATVGTGLAAGSAHATSGGAGATLTETLTPAQVALADDQGNTTTVLPHDGSPLDVEVFLKAVADPGNTVALVSVDCGTPGEDSMTVPANGYVSCRFTTTGHFTISAQASVNGVPGLSTSKQLIVNAAPAIDRFDGTSRYGTGVAVSQAAFPQAGSADAVVLARGDAFADALAGIPLAKAKNGPLLLTEGGTDAGALTPGVKTELGRVLPADGKHVVYILGGTGAVSQAVEDQVKGLGYAVVRLWGETRYDTALAIATDPRALDNPGNVVVARGDDFADALAAGPFAANADKDSHGTPAAIILSDGAAPAASLTGQSLDYVEGKLTDGGVVAVGGGAAAAVAKLPGSSGHYTAHVGFDRYGTASLVADAGWGRDPESPGTQLLAATAGLATGTSYADALTGGAFMALTNGPLLLVRPAPLPDHDAEILWDGLSPGVARIQLFGGPGAISTTNATRIAKLFGVTQVVDHHVSF